MKWKQSDIDHAPTVIVDVKHSYIGTANCATSAVLIIEAHNKAEDDLAIIINNLRAQLIMQWTYESQ